MSEASVVSTRPVNGLAGLILIVLLEASLVICWSAGFIGIRFASDHAPISLVLFWRTLVSGVVLLPFALTIGPRLRWRLVLPQMLFGALAMSAYLGAFSLAISRGVPTGLVALITDMLPLMVAVLSWPLLGQALNGRQWLGSLIGFAGVVIASGWSLTIADVPLWAYVLPMAGTLSLAMAILLQKRSLSGAMPIHQSLCIQCLTAAAIFSIWAGHEVGLAPVPTAAFVGGILWLVFVATLGAWSLYYLALQKSSPARVTSVLYLSPPVVMLWAWVVFGEPLSWAMAAGLLVSLIGIVMVARATRRT